ncbi:hypothetical protein NLJ89_g716 [Agrocybe chaxingu]|uniref:SET domain-containing protein n=1 Tax=Agrocybe chaxingu TaxID=84603 RepID=A0A9W8N195_9AGAR|nr:hypothetical protein NLJ89_g716 [Agrocybe chaxingu]
MATGTGDEDASLSKYIAAGSRPSPSNHLYEVRATPYGGRGAFARGPIAKNTDILSCAGPYASVIFRPFKKEVCAWCFAYAFESGKSKWSIKLSVDNAGAWFCSEHCEEFWIKEHELVQGEGVQWWLEIYSAFERLVAQVGPSGTKGTKKSGRTMESTSTRFAHLEDLKTKEVTQELVDKAWSIAEKACLDKGTITQFTQSLNNLELDTARYLLDGLLHKTLEDARPDTTRSPSTQSSIVIGSGRWADYLELQDNEVPHICSKPYVLASHIRIYCFLRQLLPLLTSFRGMPSRPSDLLSHSLTSSMTVRALLQRDPGNVFGIWDMAPEGEESEMLGWGAYVFGSYFNHDCEPNIKKRREGRAIVFYTIRDVSAEEELCISYVEDAPVVERIAHLERDWFFSCRCAKCVQDLANAS